MKVESETKNYLEESVTRLLFSYQYNRGGGYPLAVHVTKVLFLIGASTSLLMTSSLMSRAMCTVSSCTGIAEHVGHFVD